MVIRQVEICDFEEILRRGTVALMCCLFDRVLTAISPCSIFEFEFRPLSIVDWESLDPFEEIP